MNRILVAVAATAFVSACVQFPESKDPPPKLGSPSSAQPAGPLSGAAATEPMRSSAKLIESAAAGANASPRRVAIVKDLVIEEGSLKNFAGAELADFQLARAELAALFGAQFRESLQAQRYVDKVVAEGSAGAVIIQPTMVSLAAGHNTGGLGGIKHSDMRLTVDVTDAASGAPLGSYTVQYGGWLRTTARVPKMDVLRRVFPDAAEQAAKAIAKAG